MQVRHAQVLQVPNALGQTLEVFRKQVGVTDIADHVFALEPIRLQHAFAVTLVQRFVTRQMICRQHLYNEWEGFLGRVNLAQCIQ